MCIRDSPDPHVKVCLVIDEAHKATGQHAYVQARPCRVREAATPL